MSNFTLDYLKDTHHLMTNRLTTSERILIAGRRLFNEKGYAATTLAEIAMAVGIAQGNLTYHFPTKRDLVMRLEEEARQSMQARWTAPRSGTITDDYIEHLLFAMHLTWNNRFLLRDHAQYAKDLSGFREDPYMMADLVELRELLRRIDHEKMFRRDLEIDLDMLARSLWITSRYWMDHLRELEGLDRVSKADLERGIQHHFALLKPCLVASARRDFEAALDVAMRFMLNFDKVKTISDYSE